MSLKGNLKRVEKSYVADLENILRDIAQKYEIYDKNTNNKLTEDDLINVYILPLIEQEKQYQCSAILVNGNRCSHKSLKETKYKYCKKHLFKDTQNIKSNNRHVEYNQHQIDYNNDLNNSNDCNNNVQDFNLNIKYTNNTDHTNDLIEKNNDIDITQLIKHFIDNKLYYIDDKYIYNSDGVSKAGYLEYGNCDDSDSNDVSDVNVNYILIDDPFILQNI
jgi:hypothetical protein